MEKNWNKGNGRNGRSDFKDTGFDSETGKIDDDEG